MTDATDLAAYVGAEQLQHAALIEDTFAQAVALVDAYVGLGVVTIPEPILHRAYLECGAELWHRKDAPNGVTQFATPDGNAGVRVARDPLVGVYPLVSRFVGGGFA